MPVRAFRIGVVVAAVMAATTSTSVAENVVGIARTDHPDRRGVTGLTLAYDTVVWADRSPYKLGARPAWAVRSVRSGQLPRVRFTARLLRDGATSYTPWFTVSSTHLAVAVPTSPSRPRWKVLAGPLGGELRPLVAGGDIPLGWSGGLLVTEQDEVFSSRDPDRGFMRQPLPEGLDGRPFGFSDSWIVMAGAPSAQERVGAGDVRLDVGSLSTGEIAYSIPVSAQAQLGSVRVQADGAIAWTTAVGPPGQPGSALWSASPAEPYAHLLAVNLPGDALVQLSGNRAVFLRIAGGYHGEIVQPWVAELNGGSRPIWFPMPAPVHGDLAGDRLALAAAGCIYLGEPTTELAEPPGGTCPQQRTREGERRVWAGGTRQRFGIHCVMAPSSGCRGVARLEAASRADGRRRVVASVPFRVKRGSAVGVVLRATREHLGRLRNANGSVWTWVDVRTTDAEGLTSETESNAFISRP